MGRISMPVDIVEILALVWDHPLIAGLLMLMFTPPFFPVLVFFSPLLISTALAAVALISMGQQMEDSSKREREVAGWNARGAADGDLPVLRERATRRRRVPGEDNWLDWVKGGLEPGSVWGQTESSMFIEDVKEERLLADFRLDEGGIDMKEEEFRQQVEAFREFESRNLGTQTPLTGERSFSFRTGAAVAATIGGLDSPDRDSSRRMLVPFQNGNATDVQSPSSQIPSMFLYTLRTGGTGTGSGSGSFTEAAVPGGQRPTDRRQHQQQLQGEQQQQKKTLASFGSGFLAGSFAEWENDSQRQPQPQPQPPKRQQEQKSLVSFGSGFFSGSVEEPKKENEQQQQKQLVSFDRGVLPGTTAEPTKDDRQQQQQSELISFGSGFTTGSFEGEPEHVNQQQRNSTSPEIHVSSAEPAHFSKSVAKRSPSPQLPINSPYVDSRDSDHRKASLFDLRRERVDSRDSKPRHSQERSKGLSYNSGLIPGNAVIYTAEPSPVDTKQLQKRNSLSNRERRVSSTSSRQKRKHGMAARHALLMEKENSITGSWITTTTTKSTAR